MQTDEFYFGVTFQGNKRIFTPKGRNGKLHLPGQWAGSFSEDRPLGWDPVAEGNRAGDGMACNNSDRRQWRKQGAVVGAAASEMQADAKQLLGAATRISCPRRNYRHAGNHCFI